MRACKACSTTRATCSRSSEASTRTKRARSDAIARNVAGADALEERQVLRFEAVGSPGLGPALCGDGRVEIEPEREIGLQALLHCNLQLLEQGERLATTEALVREGGIGEAIAEHDVAARQRRRDDAADVVAARGKDQQCLRDGVHRRVQHHLPQGLGELGAAGLARHHHVATSLAQACRRRLDVRRLAGPVDAFEGDESAAHCVAGFLW